MPSTCWTSRPAPAISLRPAPSTTSLRGTPPTAPGTSCPTTERLSARAAPSSACRRLRIWTSCSFPLMTLYRHVPSITNFPVYLGNLDTLIDPFLDGWSDEEARRKLRLFLNYLDRTITDSFCHANLGPAATRAGRLLLEVLSEVQNTVPNFTLKYDPEVTPRRLCRGGHPLFPGLLQPGPVQPSRQPGHL